MKRTKKWWKKLNKQERSYIVFFDKSNKSCGNYGGGYLPDDCSECNVCGRPILGSGTCQFCYKEYEKIIEKANNV